MVAINNIAVGSVTNKFNNNQPIVGEVFTNSTPKLLRMTVGNNTVRNKLKVIPSSKVAIKKVNYRLPQPASYTFSNPQTAQFPIKIKNNRNANKENPHVTQFRVLPTNKRKRELFSNAFNKGSRKLIGGRKHYTKKRRHTHSKHRA
jgi:hypothetical protein